MSRTVLYVDDRLELPEQVSDALARVGFDLVYTPDIDEALRIVREEKPALVLAEVLLEDGTGFEFLESVVSTPGDAGRVPIVVVTRGERTPRLYGRALELGVEDYLCKPVLRAQILEAVLEFAGGGPEGDSQLRPGAAAPAISGELAQEPLPEVFQRLYRTGASGVLIVRDEAETRAIEFRNGSPIALTTNLKAEPLVDFLLRTGRLEQDEYDAAIEQVMGGGAGLAEALSRIGALTEKEVEAAGYQQSRGLLLETFRWPSGEFGFHPGRRLRTPETLAVSCSPLEVVLEGVRLWAPREVVRDGIRKRLSLYASTAENAAKLLADAELLPEEQAAFEGLGGDRTLVEVLATDELDERLLYALIAIGAVTLEADPVLMLLEEVQKAEDRELPDESRELSDLQRAEERITELAERISSQDDFSIFGIDERASDDEVRAAYRSLMDSIRSESIPTEFADLRDLADKIATRVERAYDRVKTSDSRAAFAGLRRKKQEDRKEEEDASRGLEAESWFRKGQSFLESRDYEKAVEAFGMALHLDPKQGDYSAHLGYSLYRSNPRNNVVRREALEHIAKGVKLSPGREEPLLFLSRVFRESGDPAMAEKVLRRALKLRPDSPALVQEMCLLQIADDRPKPKGLLGRFRGK